MSSAEITLLSLLRLADKIAKHSWRNLPWGRSVELGDIRQEASIIVIEALREWRPGTVRLENFCAWRCKRRLIDMCRRVRLRPDCIDEDVSDKWSGARIIELAAFARDVARLRPGTKEAKLMAAILRGETVRSAALGLGITEGRASQILSAASQRIRRLEELSRSRRPGPSGPSRRRAATTISSMTC